MLKLTFLGTGNSFGHDGRFPSCYLIETESIKILLDCGPSILPALRKIKVSPAKIDAIFLSHLHPDHSAGLPFLALDDKWISKRSEPMKIYAPQVSEGYFTTFMKLYYGAKELENFHENFEFTRFEVNDTIDISNGFAKGLPALHGAYAKMLYLTVDELSVGYSGDSAYLKESFQNICEADITIHECSTFSLDVPGHVNYLELQSKRSELELSRQKQIYLSHVDKSMVENKSEILHPFILAEDGMVIQI